MYHVLFVDDEKHVLTINRTYFEKHGYKVSVAENQQEALAQMKASVPDCIVLDVLLPTGEDGYQICRQLKSIGPIPIIFLTNLTEQDCLYRGFVVGGDDYMTKPYDLKELLLRVSARIQQARNHTIAAEILEFPPLKIDLTSRMVYIEEQPLRLTGSEFKILSILAQSPGTPFTADALYRQVWQQPDLDSTHTVQVHVARMRRKLEKACPAHRFIQTMWGRGYLFANEGNPTDTEFCSTRG